MTWKWKWMVSNVFRYILSMGTLENKGDDHSVPIKCEFQHHLKHCCSLAGIMFSEYIRLIASMISDLPINLRLSCKRVLPLVAMLSPSVMVFLYWSLSSESCYHWKIIIMMQLWLSPPGRARSDDALESILNSSPPQVQVQVQASSSSSSSLSSQSLN